MNTTLWFGLGVMFGGMLGDSENGCGFFLGLCIALVGLGIWIGS